MSYELSKKLLPEFTHDSSLMTFSLLPHLDGYLNPLPVPHHHQINRAVGQRPANARKKFLRRPDRNAIEFNYEVAVFHARKICRPALLNSIQPNSKHLG